MTFDANGNVAGVTDLQGQPLPEDLAQCFLALMAPYCYPTHAGTTQTVNTCHSWIA